MDGKLTIREFTAKSQTNCRGELAQSARNCKVHWTAPPQPLGNGEKPTSLQRQQTLVQHSNSDSLFFSPVKTFGYGRSTFMPVVERTRWSLARNAAMWTGWACNTRRTYMRVGDTPIFLLSPRPNAKFPRLRSSEMISIHKTRKYLITN
jgi:hypothetical protein